MVTAAFGHHEGVAELWEEVVGRGLVRASVVAVEGDEIVGHVRVSHAWLDARRALVAAAVDASRAAGTPALFLEGDPAFYGPRGFEAAGDLGFRPASSRTPDRAFQVVTFEGSRTDDRRARVPRRVVGARRRRPA